MRTTMALMIAAGLALASFAPPLGAAPRARLETEGEHVQYRETDFEFIRRRLNVTTLGLAGTQTVTCLNQACASLGLDGSTLEVERDLQLRIDIPASEFKGTDEELQAVVASRSRATRIFADGFESGDLASWSRTGTATCTRTADEARTCAIDVEMRGKVTAAGSSRAIGRSETRFSGMLVITPEGAQWTFAEEHSTLAIFADGFESGQ